MWGDKPYATKLFRGRISRNNNNNNNKGCGRVAAVAAMTIFFPPVCCCFVVAVVMVVTTATAGPRTTYNTFLIRAHRHKAIRGLQVRRTRRRHRSRRCRHEQGCIEEADHFMFRISGDRSRQ